MSRTILTSLLLALSLLTACDHRDIRHVVKQVAEAPTDTTGFASLTIRTNTFSTVEIDCFADVTFHQTSDNTAPYVHLQAPPEVMGHVKARSADDALSIATDRRYRMPEDVAVVIHLYAPFVSKFVLNGGKCLRLGRLALASPLAIELDGVGAVTADSLTAQEVELQINGDGSADLRGINTHRLVASINGNGSLSLSGTAAASSVSHTGNCLIDTAGLRRRAIR